MGLVKLLSAIGNYIWAPTLFPHFPTRELKAKKEHGSTRKNKWKKAKVPSVKEKVRIHTFSSLSHNILKAKFQSSTPLGRGEKQGLE
jgi:hypothetical protein